MQQEILQDPNPWLYYALVVDVKILNDINSTPLLLSEQHNIHHTPKEISAWFFDYLTSHASFYEDHPLLFDWLVTDFSYANFHAILKAFNSLSLKEYSNMAYS